MATNNTNKAAIGVAIAGLTLELRGDAPTEVHLLPSGTFRAIDGRPLECPFWQLDAVIAAAVIGRAAAQKNDILIDYEHQSLHAKNNGKRVEAAGWIPRTLEWREDTGLYAVGVTWVDDTAELIAKKKLRYASAVFSYDTTTGAVIEIISVALTNTPALDGLEALADLARAHLNLSTAMEADMADKNVDVAALTAERTGLQTQVAALTTERDGLNTQVTALTTERDGLKTKVDKIESDAAAAAQEAEKTKHTVLLTAALTDGRLTPAQKPWAEKQSVAALTEFLDASKPLPIAGGPQHKKEGEDANHGLSAEELAWCSRMDVTPENYATTKKSLG